RGHPVPACLNVLFASRAYQAVVEAAGAPLISAQPAQGDWLLGHGAEALGREAGRLTQERIEYIERIPTQPADPRYFDERLADLQLARWPVVTIDSAS